jgi:hypothetical protein
LYGQVQEITCIRAHPLTIKHQNKKRKELVLMIGFFDGNVEIYHISITMKSISLKRTFAMSPDNKEAVTNIIINKGNVFVSRLHHVQVYIDLLPAVANLIITNNDDSKIVKDTQYNIVSKNIPIKNMA